MDSFSLYLALLQKWNKTYNLTAITDPKEIQIKHFEDSLSLVPYLPTPPPAFGLKAHFVGKAGGGAKSCRLLDVGTGGGFPGIPVKIARPGIEVVLLDSSRKKIAFCQHVIRELKLEKIEAVQGRVENPDLIIEKFGLFDVVVTRATFSISDFLERAGEYLTLEGKIIMMKGKEWEKELLPSEGWSLDKKIDYELKEGLGKRTLLFFTPQTL
ncbi:MAG: 16S rRNA (guanine(527)-N(7))-methyltransferase RsmG [Deltaproteobacteria bacterium]|nr:16S rRNA (guanine(527)-N(7))-methyltransferase RsmG [Deltaproteobacteria bacterium]